MIEFKNLTKKLSQQFSITDLNLKIPKGAFTVIVGPSGSGKSTLLRLISGLEEPSSGELLLDDKNANSLSPKERDVAMVFQNYALYPHLTIAENLSFPLRVRKTAKNVIDQKIAEVASLLEIEDLLQRKPNSLSGGQKQRVAIGRCLVRNPKIFLFDEPLSNLDVRLRDGLRHKIHEIHQKLNCTTVYVTHDQQEALSLSQLLVVMDRGKIQQAGPPAELYNNPSNIFTAKFLGQPPPNVLLGQQNAAGDFIVLGKKICTPSTNLGSGGKDIYGLIRATDIELSKEHKSNDSSQFSLSTIEYMGSRSICEFARDGLSLIYETTETELERGKNYFLSFPEQKFLWFNSDGQRINL